MIVSIIIIIVINIIAISGIRIESLTFQPPFHDTDAAGLRIVGNDWRASAETTINKNFIRLTPDRQSKHGALWGRKQIGVNSFTSILQFRISGQGKNFFGDGIGFWITENAYYLDGAIHGHREKYTGIGIIFDTFKNTENYSSHRDVTVLVNDGTKTYEIMTENVVGCNTNVRYHNERADFSVTDSSSKAKITITEAKTLQIQIDARNTGEWIECVTIPDLELPAGWLPRSYIGLTASTGALADNHDIISLKTYTDDEYDPSIEEEFDGSIQLSPSASLEDKLATLAHAIDGIIHLNRHTEHALEHDSVKFDDHIRSIISKLEKKETEAEDRIKKLEEAVSAEVVLHLAERLEEVERIAKDNVDRKMGRIESSVHGKMDILESKAEEVGNQILQSALASQGSWKIPFLFILVLVAVAAGLIFMWYKKIYKTHLM